MYDDDDDNKDEDEDQINTICHPHILSLKWRNPGEWSIVSNLMCDKMNKPVWAIIQGVFQKVGNVVDHGDVVDGDVVDDSDDGGDFVDGDVDDDVDDDKI